MLKSDLVMIASFIMVLLIFLFLNLNNEQDDSHDNYVQKTKIKNLMSLPFAFIFISIFFIPKESELILSKALVFGLIAGSFFQPVIADSYLTKISLVYKDSYNTPFWMIFLWGIFLTQLSYLAIRMDAVVSSLGLSIDMAHGLFLIVGIFLFFFFESVANNPNYLWRRKNCFQVFNMAVYAFLAEVCAVEIIWITVRRVHVLNFNFIAISAFAGLLIAFCFIVFCAIEQTFNKIIKKRREL